MNVACVSWWIVLHCGNNFNVAHRLDDGRFEVYRTEMRLCRRPPDKWTAPKPNEMLLTETNVDCEGWLQSIPKANRTTIEEVCSCPAPYNR